MITGVFTNGTVRVYFQTATENLICHIRRRPEENLNNMCGFGGSIT